MKKGAKKGTKKTRRGERLVSGLAVRSSGERRARHTQRSKREAGQDQPEMTVQERAMLPSEMTRPIYRVMTWPTELWQAVRATSQTRGTSTREVIRSVLDAELPALVDSLHALGLDGREAGHRVRNTVDADILAQLARAASATGLPGVMILRLAVAQHIAKRGGTK